MTLPISLFSTVLILISLSCNPDQQQSQTSQQDVVQSIPEGTIGWHGIFLGMPRDSIWAVSRTLSEEGLLRSGEFYPWAFDIPGLDHHAELQYRPTVRYYVLHKWDFLLSYVPWTLQEDNKHSSLLLVDLKEMLEKDFQIQMEQLEREDGVLVYYYIETDIDFSIRIWAENDQFVKGYFEKY